VLGCRDDAPRDGSSIARPRAEPAMIVATIAAIAILVLVSVALSILQFRRATPLVFCCVRCGIEFRRAPHRDFARACPGCGAHDWAV
jgi:hypothetical protein